MNNINNIRTKQFHPLTDIELAWKLMTDVYDHDLSNGPAAPFLEYAINCSWMDKDYLRLNRFWFDGDLPVAFVFYENPVTSTYFVLRPGYEFLAGEMIGYAEKAYPEFDEPREFNLFSGQTALISEAERHGFRTEYEEPENYFDFSMGSLGFKLPEGYHFVDAKTSDPLKSAKCMWDSFMSEEAGEFTDWNTPRKTGGGSPHELYQDVYGATISPSPHATYDYTVIIADGNEDYVCFSGMWWVPENKLAYMEPLGTVPAHQHKGLAAAALSRHYEVMSKLGAEVMTGGGSPFYKKIGYQKERRLLHMRRGHEV